MRPLRGHERDCEDQEQVTERERRIGRLRDEHGREREIDREGVEVEGIAGGDHEPDDRLLHAHRLELAHDLRQHRIGGRGGQHDGQFLAQVGQELQDVETGQPHHDAEHAQHEDRDRHIEQRDQRKQLFERADAVATDGIGDRAEHAERRHAHDQTHGAEQHGRDLVD